MIDRDRLASLREDEEARFVTQHPRSAALAEEQRASLLAGVPMPWMTRWPGAFPVSVDSARGGRLVDVDGLEYVDLCLGDTGAMTGHALPAVTEAVAARVAAGATAMLPSADAAWVGAELGRRFGLPFWQLAISATDANRFVLRFARHLTGRPRVAVMDWCYHGTVDEALAVLDDIRSRRAAPRRPRSAGRRGHHHGGGARSTTSSALDERLAQGDVACLLMEPALTNIGIVLPVRRLLGGGPRDHPPARRAAGDRRDAHDVRRPRWLHVGVGAGAGPAGGRQGDRRRHPLRGVRHDGRGRRAALRADAGPRDRRGRRRRHAHRQRARAGARSGPRSRRRCATRTSRSPCPWPSGSPRA